MKKVYYLFAALVAALAFTSCGGDNIVEPDSVGTTYPRMQLIEHFTGEDCGYCPSGMDYIYAEYSKDPDNMVWVSNHSGYKNDEYTISGSAKIVKALEVGGAPSISVNRYVYNKSKNYHPSYIASVMKKQEKTSTCCILLDRQFDAASRNLHVKAIIKTSQENLPGVMLTLGVTESGPVGPQADYESSWEGWREFVHTHIIRVYATEPLGTEYVFKNRVAVAEFDIPMDGTWNADNCEIVAWITESATKWPVLNAAKLHVVEGTKGGEDIKHGGVTAVPVPDSYPESGAVAQEVRFTQFNKELKNQGGLTIASLVFRSDSVVARDPSYGNFYPYLELYACMPQGTSIAYGTYNVAPEIAAGNVVAATRDDEKFEISGSMIYYVFSYNNSLYIGKQWLVNAGTVVISETGVDVNITTRNGSTFHGFYNGNVNGTAPLAAPKRHQELPLMKMEGEPMNVLYF